MILRRRENGIYNYYFDHLKDGLISLYKRMTNHLLLLYKSVNVRL